MRTLFRVIKPALLVALVALVASTSAQAALIPTPDGNAPPHINNMSSDDVTPSSSNSWWNGEIDFSTAAMAPNGLTSVDLYLDNGAGGELLASDSESNQTNVFVTATFSVDSSTLDDGEECFFAVATSASNGTSASSDDYCVNISNTAPGPVLGLTSDAGNSWTNETDTLLQFDPDYNDAAPIDGAYVSVNGAAPDELDVNDSTVDVGELPEGTDNVCLWAVDAAGNSDEDNQECTTVYVDRTPPTIGTVSYDPSTETLNVPVSDSISGVADGDITVTDPDGNTDDLGGSVSSDGMLQASFPEGIPTPGNWTAQITVDDNTGNETQVSQTVVIPDTAPQIGQVAYDAATKELTVPASDTYFKITDAQMAVTDKKGKSETFNCVYRKGVLSANVAGSGMALGNWSVVITASNSEGTSAQVTENVSVGSPPQTQTPIVAVPNVTKPRLLTSHAKPGSVLKASAGKWKTKRKTKHYYDYQWQVKKHGKWVNLRKATKASLRVTRSDKGHELRVSVRVATSKGVSKWVHSTAVKVR
jgi:hypothetical protein